MEWDRPQSQVSIEQVVLRPGETLTTFAQTSVFKEPRTVVLEVRVTGSSTVELYGDKELHSKPYSQWVEMR